MRLSDMGTAIKKEALKQQTINSFKKRIEELVEENPRHLPQWTYADLMGAAYLIEEYSYQLDFLTRLQKALSRRV